VRMPSGGDRKRAQSVAKFRQNLDNFRATSERVRMPSGEWRARVQLEGAPEDMEEGDED